jgi:hypothetical protein
VVVEAVEMVQVAVVEATNIMLLLQLQLKLIL